MTYAEKATTLFCNGANCAQAVFAAFAPEMQLDEPTALKLASSFGGGMGRLREVCGAVSGMLMAYGMLRGYCDLNDPQQKSDHYANVQALANAFRAEYGAIVCRELLGLQTNSDPPTPSERNAAFYHNRACADYVAFAASLLAEKLDLE